MPDISNSRLLLGSLNVGLDMSFPQNGHNPCSLLSCILANICFHLGSFDYSLPVMVEFLEKSASGAGETCTIRTHFHSFSVSPSNTLYLTVSTLNLSPTRYFSLTIAFSLTMQLFGLVSVPV